MKKKTKEKNSRRIFREVHEKSAHLPSVHLFVEYRGFGRPDDQMMYGGRLQNGGFSSFSSTSGQEAPSTISRLVSIIYNNVDVILLATIVVPGVWGLVKWGLSQLTRDPRDVAHEEEGKRCVETLLRRQNKVGVILSSMELQVASSLVAPEQISVDFSDIGGLEDVKRELHEAVVLPLTRPELFKGQLRSIPKGVLLYGPPGTGKTMLAKAIAKSSHWAFLNLNVSQLFNMWLGESEKTVSALFSLARKIEPCMIFVDEIDCLFSSRGQPSQHEVSTRMKALFMSLWDGLGTDQEARVTIVGATNRPWDIDEAIQRRMPHSFRVPLPDTKARHSILRIILKDEELHPDFDLDEIASATPEYSGSDLLALAQCAGRFPVRELLAEEAKHGSQQTTSKNEDEGDAESQLRPLEMADFFEAMVRVKPTGSSASQYAFEDLERQSKRFKSPFDKREIF